MHDLDPDNPPPVSWKEALRDRLNTPLGVEVDVFDTEVQLRKSGKMDEKVFAETRLRRGAYGQRYDNGQRHDGHETRSIAFPHADLTKGPHTFWDAPGMLRIKIPFGALHATQMEVLADLAEEYSDTILHVTTRQDIQLHFVHIEDTPDIMRRLAVVGITTREACGNTVRNVTACPRGGVCRDEAFDITPYAQALAMFLLGHKDCQDFGRKFKVAFSGCGGSACGLTSIHDLGLIARTRIENGSTRRGFTVYVGGGLGAVPYKAQLFEEFLPEEELLPLAQAIARVFARHGEKKNRAAARLKFLLKKLGFEEFKRLVLEERKVLSPDSRWTDWISEAYRFREEPPHPTTSAVEVSGPEDFKKWAATNIYRQSQVGYVAVSVTLPLGDASSFQFRGLADLARRFIRETVRATVEQNLLFRWVREEDLLSFYQELKRLGLHEPGAETIVDVTACPGTDTCKLGIASSRGLAGELRRRLATREYQYHESIRTMRIKVSGCFNSCGQHHIADLGFYGSNRTVGGFSVPHFQVLLGGQWTENAAHYGLAIGAVPSKLIPEVVDRYIERYLQEKQAGENFREFIARIGKKAARDMIDDLTRVPSHDERPDLYSDWADSREFTISDLGKGECAGEVVSVVDFDLAAAERQVFEAQLLLEEAEKQNNNSDCVRKSVLEAYAAMMTAARALIKIQTIAIPDDDAGVVEQFRIRFYATQLFYDPFAGGKFAHYLFGTHDFLTQPGFQVNPEYAHQIIEEAQLFIEASHACHRRIIAGVVAPIPGAKS